MAHLERGTPAALRQWKRISTTVRDGASVNKAQPALMLSREERARKSQNVCQRTRGQLSQRYKNQESAEASYVPPYVCLRHQ